MVSLYFFFCLFGNYFFVCFAACGNGIIDSGEPCDGGAHCTGCACDSGFQSAPTPSLFCVEDCYNPVTPLSSLQPESTITLDLTASFVDFHALILHQSTDVTSSTGGGSYVASTAVTFGSSGTSCDYPANTMLSETLDTTTCLDDIGNSMIAFSSFSPCLVRTCTDSLSGSVNCDDPTTCVNAPCIMQWGSPVTITRNYNVSDGNGDFFTRNTASGHNVLFTFPWVQSTSVSVAIWATPDIAASAAITTIIYSAITSTWTVVVTVSLDWPYQLYEPTGMATINGLTYTLSPCSSTPSATVPCVQTLTFNVPGCTGIHTAFAGLSKSFNNLLYDCANPSSPACPLAAGTSRSASLSIQIDTEANCGTATSTTTITPSDVNLVLVQSDFNTARGSFINGDLIDFLFSVTKTLTTASVDNITVVEFQETNFGSGTSLSTTKITTAGVCSSLNKLCFTLDTSAVTLQNIPSTAQSTLHFLVTVDIQFTGISKKKRVVLSTSDVPLSASTTTTMQQESSAASDLAVLFAFLFVLLGQLA